MRGERCGGGRITPPLPPSLSENCQLQRTLHAEVLNWKGDLVQAMQKGKGRGQKQGRMVLQPPPLIKVFSVDSNKVLH